MEDKNLKWIRDIRDKNYEHTKDMTEDERREYYNEKYKNARIDFKKSMSDKQLVTN